MISMNKKKIIRAVTVSMSVGFFKPMVKDLQHKGYEVVTVSSSGPELEGLRELGVRTIEVPMERRMSPLKDLKSLWHLIRVFRKERPYMVHSMTPKAGLLCMLAAWLTRVPRRVHTFTGLVWPTSKGLSRKILMFTDWLTCACATHVNPEGEGVKQDLQQHITKKPMRVLGFGNVRGVDMDKFSRRPVVMNLARQLRNDGTFTFLFVGRIARDKGLDELVAAFTRLTEQYDYVRLILVGWNEHDIDPVREKTLLQIKNSPCIDFVGSKYGDELLAYYAASDCFVFPSYREGFPNTVMEAGAMDLPCIVTDINGSREIIEEGKNGVIIPSKNVDALYKAMEHMMTDRESYNRYAKNARPMIASRFEQGFVRKCLYDFYDEIM
ncbi:MAG: glycosyltransferase family 4 protein [Bacteroidaceae bacterium]|nr:glycosyltransferase family 4 protein [Bacteroidaceae bacterium]